MAPFIGSSVMCRCYQGQQIANGARMATSCQLLPYLADVLEGCSSLAASGCRRGAQAIPCPSDGRGDEKVTEESEGSSYRAPTIYDVAKAAGVAASTVSRAFARPGRVNAQTAQRVRQAAQQLGYRANPLARATSTGRTSMIAVIISDITNPFYFGDHSGCSSGCGRCRVHDAAGGRAGIGRVGTRSAGPRPPNS